MLRLPVFADFEVRFNPNHDPKDGRFTDGKGWAVGAGGAKAGVASKPSSEAATDLAAQTHTAAAAGTALSVSNYDEAAEAYHKTLTPAQESSLWVYRSTGYDRINTDLREGITSIELSFYPRPGMADVVKEIDSAMTYNIPNGTKLYRGMTTTSPIEFSPGAKISDKGYLSTSANRATAEEFTSSLGSSKQSYSYMFEISPKAGAKGALMHGSAVAGDESEVLMPRGSSLVVKAVRPPTKGQSYSVIEVDLE